MKTLRLFFLIVWVSVGSCLSLEAAWNFFSPEVPAKQPELVQQVSPFFTLLINPAGDAKTTGREIDGTYERGITIQCATELKKALEERIPGVRVILTRFPGEVIEPLQNAAFANRLPKIGLYVSLHFFEHTQKAHSLFIYHVLYNPEVDLWDKKNSELAFVPYDQAYTFSAKKTKTYATELYNNGKQLERSYGVLCHKPQGIPFKPLMGINAPALAFECGIRKKDDWKALVPFFVALLESFITPVQRAP